MESVKAIAKVQAGLIPGQIESEFSRKWALTSSEWQQRGTEALFEMAGKAHAYTSYLMLQNDRVSWVRTEWLWL